MYGQHLQHSLQTRDPAETSCLLDLLPWRCLCRSLLHLIYAFSRLLWYKLGLSVPVVVTAAGIGVPETAVRVHGATLFTTERSGSPVDEPC